jgi:lipopolysaccharide transport system permease protein
MSTTTLSVTPTSVARRRLRIIRPPSFSVVQLLGSLSEVQDYLDLILTLSAHRIKIRYKQSLLGISWAIFQPLSLMFIYTMLFSLMNNVPTSGIPYALLSFGGLLPWLCFQSALTGGTNGVVSHGSLISKVYFPREILPLTYVIAALFDFVIGSSVLAVMMLYYGVPITAKVLYAVPIMTTLALFVLSVSWITSMLQVRFRDIGVAIPLALQIWMFATPVVYPMSSAHSLPPPWFAVYMANPMVGLIENFRRVVLLGEAPDIRSFMISLLATIILFPIAYIFFKHADATAADII